MLRELKKKFLAFPLIIFLVFFLIWKLGILNIEQIFLEINNAACTSEESIKKELDLVGKNIFFINESSIEKKLKGKFPCVRDIELEKKILNKVKVKVEGRVGMVKVTSFTEKETLDLLDLEATSSSQAALLNWSFPQFVQDKFLADSEGVLFAKSQDENLPTLFWPEENLKVGQRMDLWLFSKVREVLTKLSTLEGSNFGGSSKMKLSSNQLLVKMGQKIVFSLEKDHLRQLASLQLILQKAKIDGRMIDFIDLRFDKPVVIYIQKKNP